MLWMLCYFPQGQKGDIGGVGDPGDEGRQGFPGIKVNLVAWCAFIGSIYNCGLVSREIQDFLESLVMREMLGTRERVEMGVIWERRALMDPWVKWGKKETWSVSTRYFHGYFLYVCRN